MIAKVRTPLLISLGVVVLGGWTLFGSLPDSGSQQRNRETTKSGTFSLSRPPQAQGQDLSKPWPWGDAPIAWGKRVPLEEATTYMRMCRCPLLPASGPASPEHVDTAWANPDGVVALEFDSGVKLAVVPDSELVARTWISGAEASISGDGWGRMVTLRDTQGLAYDRDQAHPEAIASVKWVEGHALMTVAGHGPQVVDDLLIFAEGLAFDPQVPSH